MTTPLDQFSALVIDDFPSMRTMIGGFLKSMGLTSINSAGSAQEALALLSGKKYDLVICDYNLGHGQNGQQLLEEAKHKKYCSYATIWIMVTAEKTMDMFMGAAETKPDDYLLKPITEALLSDRLHRLMEKKQSLAPIEKALHANDYLRAITLCNERLAKPSSSTQELQRIKSDLLLTTGELAAAKTYFESILATRNVAWAKTGLGKVCFLSQDLPHAKVLFEEVLAENKMYLEAADWLARTHDALGDFQSAQQVLDQAMKLSPNAVLRQNHLAEVAHRNGDLRLAQTAYEKAIKLGEFSVHKGADAYVGLAKVLTSTSDPAAALKVLKQSRDTFRDNDSAALKIAIAEGMTHHEMGDIKRATEALARAEELQQQANVQCSAKTGIDMAALLLRSGQKEKATHLLETVVKNNHDNAAILKQVSTAFEDAGMGEEGNELIRRSAQEVIDINNEGVALANAGKFEDGIKLIYRALQAMPNNDLMMTNLCGMMFGRMQRTGKDDLAIAEIRDLLERVGRINPGNKKYHLYQGMLARMTAENPI